MTELLIDVDLCPSKPPKLQAPSPLFETDCRLTCQPRLCRRCQSAALICPICGYEKINAFIFSSQHTVSLVHAINIPRFSQPQALPYKTSYQHAYTQVTLRKGFTRPRLPSRTTAIVAHLHPNLATSTPHRHLHLRLRCFETRPTMSLCSHSQKHHAHLFSCGSFR